MKNLERVLALAKKGLQVEIQEADKKINTGLAILSHRKQGIKHPSKISDEMAIELIRKYRAVKVELEKEFDEIANTIGFDLE